MRRMYSENQIKKIIEQSAAAVVEALKGQDISVEGITSKGIANTGALGNIGDVAISGNLTVSGSINGEENPSVKPIYCHPISLSATTVVRMTCLIFNNSPESFTKETFKAFILNNTNLRLMVSGGVYSTSDSKMIIASALYSPNGINITLTGMQAAGTLPLALTNFETYIDDNSFDIEDNAVNQIN